MANTFQVSSFFDTCKMIVTHDQTGQDDAIAEKFRGLQEVISLSFPRHLQMAQDVFGNSVGVGFRCQLTCQIGKNDRVAKSHPVESTDTLNNIPFEGANETEELVRRGLHLKYLPSLCLLTVAVRFHHVKGIDNLCQHLQSRQMLFNEGMVRLGKMIE
jgi:hypothetical protein